MGDNENLIQVNISALLSSKEVKSKTEAIGGEWRIRDINYIHGMPRNVEFSAILDNGSVFLRISAKIHRESAKITNVEVSEV